MRSLADDGLPAFVAEQMEEVVISIEVGRDVMAGLGAIHRNRPQLINAYLIQAALIVCAKAWHRKQGKSNRRRADHFFFASKA